MTISSDAKSKADTSARLAGVTDNPRVRALFESLAEEFAARAEAERKAETAPPLAPLEDTEQWLASLRALRAND